MSKSFEWFVFGLVYVLIVSPLKRGKTKAKKEDFLRFGFRESKKRTLEELEISLDSNTTTYVGTN